MTEARAFQEDVSAESRPLLHVARELPPGAVYDASYEQATDLADLISISERHQDPPETSATEQAQFAAELIAFHQRDARLRARSRTAGRCALY